MHFAIGVDKQRPPIEPRSGQLASKSPKGINPFQAPGVIQALDTAPRNADELALALQIREEHLRHETSLKAIGALFLLVGVLFGIAGFQYLYKASAGGRNLPLTAILPLLVLMLLFFTTGIYVRLLSRWAWLPLGAILFLGLLLFPLGTLINGYVIYLFLCRKGRTVFSPSYQRVIELTPQLQYRTSPVLIAMVIMLAIVIVTGVIAFLLGLAPRSLFT